MIDSQTVNYCNSYQNQLARFLGSYGGIVAVSMFAIALSVSPMLAQGGSETEAALLPETVSPSDQHSYVTDEYRIGVADVLGISVWREPEHSIPSVIVRPDGKISVPLLREIEVTGLTPLEVENLLTERFKEYINNPNVTVIVREIRSQLVYMTGGVNRPGSLLMRPGMTLWQALYEAGGVSAYGKRKKIYIVRATQGHRARIDFDYNAVMKGDLDADITLLAGDTIVVPE